MQLHKWHNSAINNAINSKKVVFEAKVHAFMQSSYCIIAVTPEYNNKQLIRIYVKYCHVILIFLQFYTVNHGM